MAIKTILVPVNGTDKAGAALDTAFALGRDLAAHVIVLHVSTDARDFLPLIGEGMSGALIEEMLDSANREIRERHEAAQAMFKTFCERYRVPEVAAPPDSDGCSAAWVTETGGEDEVVARRGRLVDLVVAGPPVGQDEAIRRLTLDAVLFETGKPVLVAPATPPTAIGRHVVVAWNGSVEAARTITAALAFLERAERVTVLGVETDKTPAGAAADLVEFLAWHNVEADGFTLADAADRSVGRILLSHCTEAGADLLVMGAYSHSRMRELILGGVTRDVLENAALPVLMAH